MKKYITLLCLMFIFSDSCYSQKNACDTLMLEFQWVAFKLNDTYNPFTRIEHYNGWFSFLKGYQEISEKQSVLYQENGCSILLYQHTAGIDTIFNHYSWNEALDISPEKTFYMLKGSFILKEAEKLLHFSNDSNLIRIVFPHDELNPSNVFDVVWLYSSKDSLLIKSATIKYGTGEGFQLEKQVSGSLNNRQTHRLQKLISKVQVLDDDVFCMEPGVPWLMEFKINSNLKKFFISPYCIGESRENLSIADLCYFLVGFNKNRQQE